MKITVQQMQSLGQHMVRRVNQNLIEYLRNRFPGRFDQISDSELYNFIANIRNSAQRYGVEREDNVATFLDLSVMYGQEFAEAHWTQDILSNRSLHGPDKMAVLRHRVRQSGVNI